MDALVPCDDVYRTMVARALGRVAHSARRKTSHAGRVPRSPGLRDGWLRGQHQVLCQRFGPGPRLYSLPGLHLPRAHRLQDARPGQSSLAGNPPDLGIPGGSAGVRSVATLWARILAIVGQRSQGSEDGQSRAARLAVAAGAAGAALFRLLELLRRPCPLSTSAGEGAPFRGRTD